MPGAMVTSQANVCRRVRRCSARARAGFSLIDVLVSMAVIAVLVSLMLPSVRSVREVTRRVICSSNLRQQGIGLSLYAEDNRQAFPSSVFQQMRSAGRIKTEFQDMILARVDGDPAEWDGLGLLYYHEYLNAPGVFYCPSHTGTHPFSRYAGLWSDEYGQIVINFQYRGGSSVGNKFLAMREAFLTDGMRTQADFSHKVGANVLRADYSVSWFADTGGVIYRSLPTGDGDLFADEKIEDAWQILDNAPRDKP